MWHRSAMPRPAAARPSRRKADCRRIRWLVAATITYNVIEAIIALTEGARVSSTALIGFGLDSVIEVSSAAAVAWQFAGQRPRRRGRRSRCGSSRSRSSPWPLYVAVDSIRALRRAPGSRGIHRSGSAWPRSVWSIMPVLSLRPAPRRARTRLRCPRSPTPSRPCCAPTCRRSCWSACCSTACSAGRGPTRSPPW